MVIENSSSQQSLNQSLPIKPVATRWDNDIFPVLRNSVGLWLTLHLMTVMSALSFLAGWRDYSFYRLMAPVSLLLLVAFLFMPYFRNTLKQWYALSFIVLLTLVPAWLTYSVIQFEDPEGKLFRFVSMSRGMPMLYCALVLSAWYYGFKGAAIYTLVSVGGDLFIRFGLGFHIAPDPIQFVAMFAQKGGSFIAIGFLVSSIVNHVRDKSTELIAANSRLVHYSDALEELAVNKERTRMARELHDTLAHSLTALTIQLEATKALMGKGDKLADTYIQTALDTARSGLKETRYALNSLRSNKLQEAGLSQSLKDLSQETTGVLNLVVDVPEIIDGLNDEQEHAFYRVAHEAVHNAVKHSNASEVKLSVVLTPSEVKLSIQDDGVGFDTQAKAEGFGLIGMAERSLLVNATVHIASELNSGTTITLTCTRT